MRFIHVGQAVAAPLLAHHSLRLGAHMDLYPFPRYGGNGPWFPVKVTELYSNGWRFDTKRFHPDHPGFIKFTLNRERNGHLTLHVHGVCHICGSFFYKWVVGKRWGRLASNLRILIKDLNYASRYRY